jgi:hypothetical protein
MTSDLNGWVKLNKNMSLSNICSSYINSAKLKDDSERNIIEFAEAPWGLGMGTVAGVPPLLPVQKFVLKCYYNIPLDPLERNIIIKDRFNEQERFRFTEMEYFKFLQDDGRINIKEVTGDKRDIRPNLCLVIGRRGTKSTTISLIVSFETYKLIKKISPQEYYKMLPDQEIRITSIATGKEQAANLFRMITGHIERSDYFKKYRNKPTMDYMQLSTQRDIDMYGPGMRPSLRIVAAPCSGRGTRGHNNIIAIMDEMGYFFESGESADKSDKNIYDSMTPSVARFNSPNGEPQGKVICISSPAARTGKFHDIYQRSFEKDCNDLLMIRAPTWEVDYTLSPQYLRSKYAESPSTYMVEFGAEFSDRVSAWIENEQVLRVNIIPSLKMKPMTYEQTPHFLGIDLASKNDGCAVAITHVVKKEYEGGFKNFIELDYIDVRYAQDEDKEFFRIEDQVKWIYDLSRKFFITKGMIDQYMGYGFLPAFHDIGLKQVELVPMTRDMNSKIYQNLMSKMLDAALRIPECDDEREVDSKKTKDLPLITELLRLKCVIHSKYMIEVRAPEIVGIHDDLSDAYARSVYLATEFMSHSNSISKNNIIDNTSKSNMTYRQYNQKQKKSSVYTGRPSTAIQMDTARSRQATSMSGLGSRIWR